jgi:hypothetical protein
MALFTDQNTTTIEDLRRHESGILDLAASEGIDLNAKLRLAYEEVSLELSLFLRRRAGGIHGPDHAVTNVVVTDGLRRWCALQTLSAIYRDTYSSQLNDRYRAKWQEYERAALRAAESLFEYGVGVVVTPIARGHKPSLSPAPAPGAPAGTYYVSSSWVGSQGVEGCASDVATIDLNTGFSVTVDAGEAVAHGLSWNVYAGRSPFEMLLQNLQPIPSGQTWTMPASGLIDGRMAGSGQVADYLVRQTRVLPRG